MPIPERRIIHIDMDAFYASVEQRDFPEYREKPVVVGGSPSGRGVVAAASYEARKFGIHSAMPSHQAIRKCPDAIFIPPRFEVYRAVSKQIREIFFRYTDLVEPLSLDEAYLDVTENHLQLPSGTLIAQKIKKDIKTATRLTASAGVSYNKFLAKMASDLKKPDGLAVITPEEATDFLNNLKVGEFHGVGRVTEKKMHNLGIQTGKDLKSWTEMDLIEHFGKHGRFYYRIVRGIDPRPVSPDRTRKSYGKERTFSSDVDDPKWIQDFLRDLAGQIAEGMSKHGFAGKTVTLKVRYENFQTITRSTSFSQFINEKKDISEAAIQLLEQTEIGQRKVRLLGITLSNLNVHENGIHQQLEIPFDKALQN